MSIQNSGSTKKAIRTMYLRSAKENIFRLKLYVLLGSFFLILGGAKVTSKSKVKKERRVNASKLMFKPKAKVWASTVTTKPSKVEVCQDGGAVALSGNIVISEGAVDDFKNRGTMTISFGSDFTLAVEGASFTGTGGTALTTRIVNGGSDIEIDYDFTAAGLDAETNTIEITGIMVTAANTATPMDYDLKITGGTAAHWGLTGSEDLATINVPTPPDTPGAIIGGNNIFAGETTALFAPDPTLDDEYEWELSDGTYLQIQGTSNLNYVTLGTKPAADNITTPQTVNVRVRSRNTSTGCFGPFTAYYQITIKPRGIIFSDPSTQVCADETVTILNDIVLTEQFFGDFANTAGTNTFRIDLAGSGYSFDQTAGEPTVIFTNSSNPAANFTAQLTGEHIEVSYHNADATSLTKLNSLIISGIGVKATPAAAGTATLTITGINDTHLIGLNKNLTALSGIIGTLTKQTRPSQPTAVRVDMNTGVTSLCTNTSVTLDVDNALGGGGRSYNWVLPSGINITSDDPNAKSITVSVTSAAVAGDITVTATETSTGCISPPETLSITLSAGLTTSDIPTGLSGDNAICIGTSVLYSVNPLAGSSGYEWNFPNGEFVVESSDTTNLDPNPDDGISKYVTTSNFIRLRATGDGSHDLTVRGVTSGCGKGGFTTAYPITVRPVADIVIRSATAGETFTEGQAFTSDGPPINIEAVVAVVTPDGGSETINPAKGTFSGNGVTGDPTSGYTFNPADAALGTNTITYTFDDNDPNTPCVSRAQVNIIIAEPSGIPGAAKAYCQGDQAKVNINIETLLSVTNATLGTGRYIIGLQKAEGLTGTNMIDPTLTSPTCNAGTVLPASGVTQDYTFKPASVTPGVLEVPIYAYVVTRFAERILFRHTTLRIFDPFVRTNCRVSTQLLGTINIIPPLTPIIDASPASTTVCGNGTTEYSYRVQNFDPANSYTWEIVDNVGNTTPTTYGTFVGTSTDVEEVTVRWTSDAVGQMPKIKVTESKPTGSGGSCSAFATRDITVQEGPGLSLALDRTGTVFCAGIPLNYTVSVISGASNGTYTWEIVDGRGAITPSASGESAEVIWIEGNTTTGKGRVQVTTTNAAGCEGSTFYEIDIDPVSAVTINGKDVVCAGDLGETYDIVADDADDVVWEVRGGTITTTTGTLTVAPDGTNTLVGKGIDVRSIVVDWGDGEIGQVKATKSTASACNGFNIKSITITPLPVITSITNLEAAYCNTTTSVTLTPVIDGSPTGTSTYALYRGTTRGTDVSGTYINPNNHTIDLSGLYGSSTTAEQYLLDYTFTNTTTGCSKTETYNFEIVPQPMVSFSIDNGTLNRSVYEYCSSNSQVQLTPNRSGGTFTVTRVSDRTTVTTSTTNTIPFSSLGTGNIAGRYRVSYELVLGSCVSNAGPTEFEIFNSTGVSVNTGMINGTGYCVRGFNTSTENVIPGETVALEVNTAANGSISAGTLTTPSGLLNGTAESPVRYFEIKRKEAPDTDYEILVDGAGNLSRSFDAGRPLPSQPQYTHNDGAVTTAQWNALAGTYQIRYHYRDTKGCTSTSAPIDIIVRPLPIVNFTGVTEGESFCENLTSVTLEPLIGGIPPASGAGTGTFIITNTMSGAVTNETDTDFNPMALQEGSFTIQYRFEETGGCTEFSEVRNFVINGNPSVGFTLGNRPVGKNIYCISGDANEVVFVPEAGKTGGTFTIQKNEAGSRIISLGAGDTEVRIDALEGTGKYNVTYEFTASGCSGSNTINDVFEIVALPSLAITNINTAGYCAQGATPFTLQPRNINNASNIPAGEITTRGFFEIKKVSGENADNMYTTLVEPGTTTPTAQFNPSRPLPTDPVLAADAPTSAWNALAGEYRVTYTYTDGNGCTNTSPEVTIIVNRTPKLTFTGLESKYCDDVGLVTLNPFDGESRITSSVVFKYRNTTQAGFTNFTQGNSFSPKTLGAGTYEIVLESSASGCTNSSQRDTTYLVTIQPTPKKVRLTATQTFGENKIQFVAGADNTNENWTWAWDFRDGTLSNERNPLKPLISIAPQVINYTFVPGTADGCTATIEKSFKMEFDVENLCVGAATQFTNKSELPRDEIGSIVWDFGDNQGTSTDMSPSYSYSAPGTYIVKLTMTTKDGVATYVLNRRVDIFPLITVNDTQFYNEEFENGNGGWISHGVVDVNQVPIDSTSWKLKQPDGFLIRNSNGNAWITDNSDNASRTNTDVNYNNNEQSYVESPCFDIGGLNKPMISFRYWSDTDQGSDGVSLLYTIDDGKTWTRLGEKDLGIDWYDTRPILGAPGDGSSSVTNNANPGNEGWSGRNDTEDGSWKTARFSLTSVLIAMQQQGITTNRVVRFRMVFGSNGDNPPGEQFDGFAFDGVRISNRNRIVLLEYFINAGTTNAAALDLEARRFPDDGNNNEVISIHNHTDFPGADDINAKNDKDPSARAFYHGIRDIPRGVLDGYTRDEVLGKWATDLFADRTLIPSPFLITINQPTVANNQLSVSADIQALEAFDRKVVMHVVVIDSVTTANGQTFYNATRKFLPDAAGTYWDTPWASGDVQSLSFNWDVGDLDPTNFRVVVFIEDYETREVHQAGVLSVNGNRQGTNGGNQVEHVTGVNDPLPNTKMMLYPNPATSYLQVKLETEKPLSNQAYWQVINIQGQVMQSGAWVFNQRSKQLNVGSLAEGVYILQIFDGEKAIQQRFERK